MAAVGENTYMGTYGQVGAHKVFHQAWDSRKLGPERALEVYAMEQTTFSSSTIVLKKLILYNFL